MAAGKGHAEVFMDWDASESAQMRDPYQILGMPRSASADEVKKRFRRLAKTLHPDANKGDPRAAERFAELNFAREILGNEDKRKAFDRGEIDARGNPARRGSSPTRLGRSRSSLHHIAARVAIAALILAVTPALIIRNLTQGEINANNNSNGSVMSGLRIDEEHAVAARSRQPDHGVGSGQRLIFQQSVSRAADGSFPLGVQVSGGADGLTLEIRGLPTGMTISSGRSLGAGQWRILATDIGNATVHPPQGFDGLADLDIELRRSDDSVADHRTLHVKWLPRPAVAVRGEATVGAARKIATRASGDQNASALPTQFDRARIDFLVKRGVALITEGDIMAARLLLQRAAEAHDARAAFALGTTYDPIMLAMLQAQGVTADVRLALDWYKKASEFGSHEARQRLNVLAALR